MLPKCASNHLKASLGIEKDAEIERLRALVGPDEKAYETLQSDVDAARSVAREAESGLGALRGKIVELHVELDRLRQNRATEPAKAPTRAASALDLGRAAVQRLRGVWRRVSGL